MENSIKPLLEHFHELDEHYKTLYSILKKHKVLNQTYEDDILKNPLVAYRKVCNFVGVKDSPAKIDFERTNPFKMRDTIENFDEVKTALHNTKYEWMTIE